MHSHTLKQPSESASTTHRSLGRGLAVLEAVATAGRPCSLSEAAERAGLHRSTAHHLLQALVSLRYLRQDPQTRGYEVAANPFKLTSQIWTPQQLGQVAQPFLAELSRRTDEGSSMSAYRDGSVTIVAKHDSDGPVRVVLDIGTDRPLHATAVGKAIVAFLPEHDRVALLRRMALTRFTKNTITTRSAFEDELRQIRRRGFAVDDEEHHVGIRCVAAPIFWFDGQVIGSLCSVGPTSRMTRPKLKEARATLLSVAKALCQRFDGTGEERSRRRRSLA